MVTNPIFKRLNNKSIILAIIAIVVFLLFLTQLNLNRERNNTPISKSADETDITVLLTGDIMLGRSVMGVSLAKDDPNYPFKKVADILKKSDVVFGNLENPIVANCPTSDSGFKFCADPKMVQGLSYAGVDIVNLANNHISNYGQDGINQTEKYLSDAGIGYVGTGNLVIRNIKGTRLGFLGFDFLDYEPKDTDYKLIENSKKQVDILIVMVHWGVEYVPLATDTQKLIGNQLVSSGADVVVGSHPHVVQNTDYINGKPIFYSLGNFVMDQSWSEETKSGLAVRLTYKNGKLLSVEKLPVYMESFAQPAWVN